MVYLEERSVIVICVLWKGFFKARKYISPGYTEEWVVKLRNMVERHLSIPHEFVCLTNVGKIEGIRCIPLKYEHTLPGWWAKFEMFKGNLPIPRNSRVLYLDLDSIILEDLRPFLEYESEMAICPAFGRAEEREKKEVYGYNSSVIVFDYPVKFYPIWGTFIKRRKYFTDKYRGDQDVLKVMVPGLPVFPREWIKKLGMCINKRSGKISLDGGMKIMLSMPIKNEDAAKRYKVIRELWQ